MERDIKADERGMAEPKKAAYSMVVLACCPDCEISWPLNDAKCAPTILASGSAVTIKAKCPQCENEIELSPGDEWLPAFSAMVKRGISLAKNTRKPVMGDFMQQPKLAGGL